MRIESGEVEEKEVEAGEKGKEEKGRGISLKKTQSALWLTAYSSYAAPLYLWEILKLTLD